MAAHPGGLWIYTELSTFKCHKPDGERTKQDLDQSVSLIECLIQIVFAVWKWNNV